MSLPRRNWRTGGLGFFSAALALVVQIMTGGVLAGEMARRAQLADIAATAVICHEDAPADGRPGTPDSGHHHALDCVLCCLCHGVGPAGMVLAAAPFLPAPRLATTPRAVRLPPARAPPALALAHAYPRGPPLLS